MKKTGLVTVLSLLLALLIAVPTYATPSKDESIYASLDYDGTVSSIEAVNRFTGMSAGESITDYGVYGDVTNLTNDIQPTLSDDSVTWEIGDTPPEEFYYQGTLDKELPYAIAIRYLLDGQAVTGDSLGGKSGRIIIEMDIQPNTACDEQLRENLMVQGTMSLDSEKCRNIQADGATLVVMGGYINLSYTILPGEEASYTLSMDAEDFSMGGITFNLISYENMLGNFQDDLDELTDGFDTMADSMDEMIDGTGDLQDGLSDMVDGLHDLDTGLSDLDDGAVEFASGMGDFGDGIDDLRDGLTDLADGSQQIEKGLKDINSAGSPLLDNYKGIYQYLVASYPSDPMVAQLNVLNAGLSDYMDGISTFTHEYATFHRGIQKLPGKVKEMKVGFNELNDGYTDIEDGIGDLSEGMHTMYTETAGLPADIQELIDGQVEFQDGIVEAKDETQDNIDSYFPKESDDPVSFADTRNTVSSVQYMLKTPDFEEAKESSPDLEDTKEDQGFFKRLIALFQN